MASSWFSVLWPPLVVAFTGIAGLCANLKQAANQSDTALKLAEFSQAKEADQIVFDHLLPHFTNILRRYVGLELRLTQIRRWLSTQPEPDSAKIIATLLFGPPMPDPIAIRQEDLLEAQIAVAAFGKESFRLEINSFEHDFNRFTEMCRLHIGDSEYSQDAATSGRAKDGWFQGEEFSGLLQDLTNRASLITKMVGTEVQNLLNKTNIKSAS
ncbi:MAG: hypothetical protein HKL82_07380 [Acidimicrobiaceae bacterium]|nr:hypothetical protein [Acidimicrobiaceae bacterium]